MITLKPIVMVVTLLMSVTSVSGCSNSKIEDITEQGGSDNKINLLGAMTPQRALEYMKSTPNLVIVDVREPQWIGNTYFKGAMFIPHSEMAARYKEIPNDRPVILNCGAGVMAPRAYQTLLDVKADILQLSYIAGAPLFSEYNRWIEQQ